MAESCPYQKGPHSPLGNREPVQSKARPSGPVRSNVAVASESRRRNHEPPLLVESDLSGDMAVDDQELDAIIRLLGGALDEILSGAGGG